MVSKCGPEEELPEQARNLMCPECLTVRLSPHNAKVESIKTTGKMRKRKKHLKNCASFLKVTCKKCGFVEKQQGEKLSSKNKVKVKKKQKAMRSKLIMGEYDIDTMIASSSRNVSKSKRKRTEKVSLLTQVQTQQKEAKSLKRKKESSLKKAFNALNS